MTLIQIKAKQTEAEKARTHSESALLCRALLEEVIAFIYVKADVKQPKGATLLELIDNIVISSYINNADIVNSLHYIRILGMNAKHGLKIRKKEAKLALENITCLIDLISAKESGTEANYSKPPYMSEAATRKLYIDLYLQEAGWSVLEEENVPRPGKAGIEIEVQGMPNANGVGYCDYVLYGKETSSP